MKTLRRLVIAGVIVALMVGVVAYFRTQVYFSHGSYKQNKIFEVIKGQGNAQIAANLQEAGLISDKLYFLIYLKSRDLTNKIYPGEYLLSGDMTIPDIAVIITNPKKVYEKVLFKEGWTAKQMADELTAHGFDVKAFSELVAAPPQDIVAQFPVLADKPAKASLEGYLFPDTYYFSKEATLDGILKKMLSNTELKISDSMRADIKNQNKTIFEIMTMASIVEKEVQSDADRNLVSGIFWNRIKIGQALQSDATLTYILGDKETQHSGAALALNSPYNSYQNKGLPPGPISNPGISAIRAAIYPQDTDYNYFLSDPKTGQTIFSKTYEEHVENKTKYGL